MGTGTVNSKIRYLNSLKEKHRSLDNEIQKLYSAHAPDNQIAKMKKEKLALKTSISNLETELAEK